jgi:hypothetical protein
MMTRWTIFLYHPNEDKSIEFQLDSEKEPTDSEILNELEIYVSVDSLGL